MSTVLAWYAWSHIDPHKQTHWLVMQIVLRLGDLLDSTPENCARSWDSYSDGFQKWLYNEVHTSHLNLLLYTQVAGCVLCCQAVSLASRWHHCHLIVSTHYCMLKQHKLHWNLADTSTYEVLKLSHCDRDLLFNFWNKTHHTMQSLCSSEDKAHKSAKSIRSERRFHMLWDTVLHTHSAIDKSSNL